MSETRQDSWALAATAPPNRAIQVYVPGLDYYGNEGVYAGMLVDMGTGPRWMTFAWAMGRDMIGENRPTHWRDLPRPPTPPPIRLSRTGGLEGMGIHRADRRGLKRMDPGATPRWPGQRRREREMNSRASQWEDGWFVTETIVNQEEHDGGAFDFGATYEDGSLDRVLLSLQAIRELIPEEYRAAARCAIESVSGYEGSHYAKIEVSYRRPATPEEIAEVQAMRSQQSAMLEAKERAELAALQAKYGQP